MKIRHNAVPYIIPGFLAICCFSGVISESDKGAYAIMTAVIVVACLIHYFHSFLSFKDGLVKGKVGLIKTKTLTSPIGKIQYCELTKFLCFNKIKINAITGTYIFKNMSHAKAFVDTVNAEMVKSEVK